jgi:drug/metabolite transporter (DMT)-like permease
VLWALTLAGLFGQIGGNVLFQWALGIVGLGLAVPLCMGMIIVSSALLARIYLNEAATPLAVFSMALLVAAIWILSLGAGDAYRSVASDAPRLGLIAAGVTGACVSGFAYSVLGVVIRYGVSGRASIAATTFTVTFVGILVLGVWSVASVGLPGLCATHPNEWAIMLSAGVFNLVAFLALAKALQLTSLVYVNGLNASQVAMAAVAGVLMFGESLSVAMVVGVMLTAIGLLLMPR